MSSGDKQTVAGQGMLRTGMHHLSFKGPLIADTGIRSGQRSKERILWIQAVAVWLHKSGRKQLVTLNTESAEAPSRLDGENDRWTEVGMTLGFSA